VPSSLSSWFWLSLRSSASRVVLVVLVGLPLFVVCRRRGDGWWAGHSHSMPLLSSPPFDITIAAVTCRCHLCSTVLSLRLRVARCCRIRLAVIEPSRLCRSRSSQCRGVAVVSGCRFVLGSGVRCADTGFMVKTNHNRCCGSYLLTHLMGLPLPGSPLVFSIPNFSVELT